MWVHAHNPSTNKAQKEKSRNSLDSHINFLNKSQVSDKFCLQNQWEQFFFFFLRENTYTHTYTEDWVKAKGKKFRSSSLYLVLCYIVNSRQPQDTSLFQHFHCGFFSSNTLFHKFSQMSNAQTIWNIISYFLITK